jgi:hypothetical protein
MSPHDGGGHDEEPNVDQYDDQHWNNERPNKVSLWVQETPIYKTSCTSIFILKGKLAGFVFLGGEVGVDMI